MSVSTSGRTAFTAVTRRVRSIENATPAWVSVASQLLMRPGSNQSSALRMAMR